VHSLPLFHRIAGQRVIVLGEGPAAEAKQRLVERAGGMVVGEDDTDARLAFIVATQPEPIVERLRARGVLVNVADRPELCDFTLPSVLERGPVLVAVGTGGASAGLAKQLRLRLEALLPQSLGDLASRLGEARDTLRARWPDADDRRRALDAALARGGLLDPLDSSAAERLPDWLTESDQPCASRTVEIIPTSEDPDDLTFRQGRLLGEADAVIAGDDVPAAVLARARADAVRLPAGSEPPTGGLTVVLRRR
jgi:uroporphyrin-III C-methyltransferase/precorrin-2 dehydrogenase/sirohydrochlorin ferrochelatase